MLDLQSGSRHIEQKYVLNSLSANPTKWSNILKQFVGKLPTNCLSVFDDFVGLALKGLKPQFFSVLKKILQKVRQFITDFNVILFQKKS